MPRTKAPSAPATYAAFLGNNPELSRAELLAFFTDATDVKMLLPGILVFQTAQPVDQEELNLLGGTIFLFKHLPEVTSVEQIPQALAQEAANTKGKITFSLRVIGLEREKIHQLYRVCKDYLKKQGRAVRYVGTERKSAVSILLHDAGLIDGSGGCEICIFAGKDFFWAGRTVAAQDPDAYTIRDMQKPVRDTRAGLLPPKLAQIMLNFGAFLVGGVKSDEQITVFDPFCGTGVIPLEALYRRWPVFASDKSQKAVTGCEANLDWMRKEEEIKKSDVASKCWKQDATKPFEFKELPHVVVTETMLGPPLTSFPTKKDAVKIQKECDQLERDFLANAAESLPGVPLVLMFPQWHLKTEVLRLEKIWSDIEKLGYKAVLPPGVTAEDPSKPSIVYHRKGQFVGREIVLLQAPEVEGDDE